MALMKSKALCLCHGISGQADAEAAATGSLNLACTLGQTLLDVDEQQLHCLHLAEGSMVVPLTGIAVSTLQRHAASASRAHTVNAAERRHFTTGVLDLRPSILTSASALWVCDKEKALESWELSAFLPRNAFLGLPWTGKEPCDFSRCAPSGSLT